MTRLLERFRFWRKLPEDEISVCMEIHAAGEEATKPSQVFKLTHKHLKHMSEPDQIIAEWLSLPNTEMVLYFKRASHQEKSTISKENYHDNS